MPWIAPAVIGGASLLSGAMGADAAKSAAGAQTAAADRSTAEQRRQFDLTRSDNAPFLKTGTSANKRLAQLLGIASPTMSAGDWAVNAGYTAPVGRDWSPEEVQYLTDKGGYGNYLKEQGGDTPPVDTTPGAPASGSLLSKFSTADLNADPVYNAGLKFGLDRGTEGINSRATASGMYDSGQTLKALTQFGNDYGSTKANEAYNRSTNDKSNIYSRLTGTSGSGQVAVGSNAAAGANATNSIGASLEGAGNARAAGVVGGANAWGNAIGGVGGAYNNYNNSEILKKLLERSGSGTTSYDPSMYPG